MPQLQFVDIPGIGSALGQFGSGLLDAYTANTIKNRDEDALQQLIGGIDPNASEQDQLMQILKAKGVPLEKKQTIADVFGKAKQRAADKAAAKEKADYQRQIEALKLGQKERELDIKEAGLQGKKSPLSEKEKIMQKEFGKQEAEIVKELPKINSSLRIADEVGNLIEATTGTGNLSLENRSKLDVASSTLLEPLIKIYNPTGQMSAVKLKWITDRFKISNNELRSTQRGKLESIKSLLNEQKRRLEERQKLINEYGGDAPKNVLDNFDKDSEKIYDQMSGFSAFGEAKPAPPNIQKAFQNADKSKVINGPEGKSYKWQGDQWVQI